MAITVQDVVNEAPELASYALTTEGAAFIAGKITIAAGLMNREVWGEQADYAWALLTAHLVLASQPSLRGLLVAGGILTSQSVGSASESYASGKVPTGQHSFTRPGALYDSLLETVLPPFMYYGG